MAIRQHGEGAVDIAQNAGGAGGELIRGWAGICEEVRRSRVQIWRDVRAGRFPAPIEIGPNSIAWFRSEIQEWKRSRPRRTYRSSQADSSIPIPRARWNA
jgi:prophage regulatory protein